MTKNITKKLKTLEKNTASEKKEALAQYNAMWNFFGNLAVFLLENRDRFINIDIINKAKVTQWDEDFIFDAIGYREAKESYYVYYIAEDFFETLLKPLPLHCCIGFLISLRRLHIDEGKLLYKKPFKGREAMFYALKGETIPNEESVSE